MIFNKSLSGCLGSGLKDEKREGHHGRKCILRPHPEARKQAWGALGPPSSTGLQSVGTRADGGAGGLRTAMSAAASGAWLGGVLWAPSAPSSLLLLTPLPEGAPGPGSWWGRDAGRTECNIPGAWSANDHWGVWRRCGSATAWVTSLRHIRRSFRHAAGLSSHHP